MSDTVNSRVDALVCGVGVKGTKKYERAQDLQIPTISVEELFQRIGLGDMDSASRLDNDDVGLGLFALLCELLSRQLLPMLSF